MRHRGAAVVQPFAAGCGIHPWRLVEKLKLPPDGSNPARTRLVEGHEVKRMRKNLRFTRRVLAASTCEVIGMRGSRKLAADGRTARCGEDARGGVSPRPPRLAAPETRRALDGRVRRRTAAGAAQVAGPHPSSADAQPVADCRDTADPAGCLGSPQLSTICGRFFHRLAIAFVVVAGVRIAARADDGRTSVPRRRAI